MPPTSLVQLRADLVILIMGDPRYQYNLWLVCRVHLMSATCQVTVLSASAPPHAISVW